LGGRRATEGKRQRCLVGRHKQESWAERHRQKSWAGGGELEEVDEEVSGERVGEEGKSVVF